MAGACGAAGAVFYEDRTRGVADETLRERSEHVGRVVRRIVPVRLDVAVDRQLVVQVPGTDKRRPPIPARWHVAA